jgi:hypothetical protein
MSADDFLRTETKVRASNTIRTDLVIFWSYPKCTFPVLTESFSMQGLGV